MDKSSTPKIETEKSIIKVPFPPGTKLNYEEGEKVKEGEILGQVIEKGEVKEYDLAKILKASPKKIKKFLLCSLGSKVHKDQLIGEKKSLFGSNSFKTPISGSIEALTEKGVLKIRISGEKIGIPTPVSGTIRKITSATASIEFPALVLKAEEGYGGEDWGVLQMVGNHKKNIDLADLGREDKGRIIVMAGKATRALLNKAEALGVIGIVANQITQEDSDDFISLTVGSKEDVIPEKIWRELSQRQDKKVFISGKNKELVIPVVK